MELSFTNLTIPSFFEEACAWSRVKLTPNHKASLLFCQYRDLPFLFQLCTSFIHFHVKSGFKKGNDIVLEKYCKG